MSKSYIFQGVNTLYGTVILCIKALGPSLLEGAVPCLAPSGWCKLASRSQKEYPARLGGSSLQFHEAVAAIGSFLVFCS